MNKKIFSCLFFLLSFMPASFSVGEAQFRGDIEGPLADPNGIDYKQIYHTTLEELHHWVADQVRLGDEEAPRQIGYFLKDISGDGVPELIVGAVTEEDGPYRYGSELYAVYSCSSGSVKRLFFDAAHQSYRLLSDGRILVLTIDGVRNFGVGVYRISLDGASFTCQDYYFAIPENESAQRGDVYHNTTGRSEIAASEKTDLTLEDVLDMGRQLAEQAQSVQLYPFSLYLYAPQENFTPTEPLLQVTRIDDAAEGTVYDFGLTVMADTHVSVLLSADRVLQDVGILALGYLDMEGGQPVFATHTIATLHRLEPGHPVLVDLPLPGTIPNSGFSYMDERGETHTFALKESGWDGSLFLEEIEPGGRWEDFGMLYEGYASSIPGGEL